MVLGFAVGDVAFEVGSSDFLKGFFSTISHYLEPQGWGTKYPELMLHLYQGQLDAHYATKVLRDLDEIQHALRPIRPVKIIWDIQNPQVTSPWRESAVPPDKDLSN